jgi:hypothetical protein
MSESEGKRELTGLARSIDALFTRPPEASLPSEDVMSVVADLDPPPLSETPRSRQMPKRRRSMLPPLRSR